MTEEMFMLMHNVIICYVIMAKCIKGQISQMPMTNTKSLVKMVSFEIADIVLPSIHLFTKSLISTEHRAGKLGGQSQHKPAEPSSHLQVI